MNVDLMITKGSHDSVALPLELVDLVIQSIDEDDIHSLRNCALANSYCLRAARKRMFSRTFILDSVEKCLTLKAIIDSTPIVARFVQRLRIRGGYVPDCVSEHSGLEDEDTDEEGDEDVFDVRQLWLNQAYPVWKELPCVRDLSVCFVSAAFLAQWTSSLTDFAIESVESLDLFHMEFRTPLQFQTFISAFKNLRHLTLSRINNEDSNAPLVVEGMPSLPVSQRTLPPPRITKLTLKSTSYSEDWRLVSEWLIDPSLNTHLRELWYLYDDNLYYTCYLADIIAVASHSLERLSLGFVWEGLWADNRNGPDELERFDDDLRAIKIPHLRYLCLFGDLSVRSVMSILSLAPLTLEELVFNCGTQQALSWIHEPTVAVVWKELMHPRFSGLNKLVFKLWGRPKAIEFTVSKIRKNLSSIRGNVLEIPPGELTTDNQDRPLVKPLHHAMLL